MSSKCLFTNVWALWGRCGSILMMWTTGNNKIPCLNLRKFQNSWHGNPLKVQIEWDFNSKNWLDTFYACLPNSFTINKDYTHQNIWGKRIYIQTSLWWNIFIAVSTNILLNTCNKTVITCELSQKCLWSKQSLHP